MSTRVNYPDLWARGEYEDVNPGHIAQLTLKPDLKKVLIIVLEVEKDRIKGRRPPASASRDTETFDRSTIEDIKFLMINGEVVTKA